MINAHHSNAPGTSALALNNNFVIRLSTLHGEINCCEMSQNDSRAREADEKFFQPQNFHFDVELSQPNTCAGTNADIMSMSLPIWAQSTKPTRQYKKCERGKFNHLEWWYVCNCNGDTYCQRDVAGGREIYVSEAWICHRRCVFI